MGKHKKHEEHENHERWLVCYADMVTLLFALFVVLYSMGVTELEKISQVAKSIQWAFHIEGSGKTLEEGVHDSGSGDGRILNSNPMQTGQEGPMEEYLDSALEEDFERITGNSLDIEVLDDTFRVTSPMSAWFRGTETETFANGDNTYRFLVRLVSGASDRAAEVRIRIESPFRLVGTRGGRRITSHDLCHDRLCTFFRALSQQPHIREGGIQTEFRELRTRYQGSWQDAARVVIEFGNGKPSGGGGASAPDKR